MSKKIKNIKAEGGGCFPAGTKINTPSGYRFIEDLKVGDEVYAFDLSTLEVGMPDEQPGRIFIKKITETFVHSFGEVGYTSPLLEISYAGVTPDDKIIDGSLQVTGNHYILTPSKQSDETDPGFARADQLEVGDTLWLEYGEEVKVTKIESAGEYDFVYNFEVEDLATYIADKVRVHNGGGGKGKRTPRQATDTIRNKQVIRVLLSPGEGESGGLYNSANIGQSVYFDGQPIQDADGSFTFPNIAVTQRVGLPDQTVIEGFSAVEAEQLLGVEVKSGTPVIRTLSSALIDAVRITIEFPQGLQKISKDSGDANGYQVAFNIARRISGGTWETAANPIISEMSSGGFTSAFLIQRPAAAGTWEFRVTRLTPESAANEVIDTTFVDSYTEIQNVALPYNDRGLVAIVLGADSTAGRIPTIALDWVGVKVQVPSNYNAVTKTYTGTWNGAFATTRQNSDNPAWVLYDLLTHPRYGLGDRFTADKIDKFSFYAAAQYCDELVADGKGTGTMEPRFTFNAQLMVRENAWKTLNTIAAVMNAKLYMHAGLVRIAQDRPASVNRIINNSNILDGIFSYSSSTVEETYTQCNVTFNDPLDNFLPRTVSQVAPAADRVRYGLNEVDLAAYGATSEGQARRAAKWVLDTSLRQSSMVTFGVSLENAGLEPNEIFYLMDEDYSQTTQEGRVVAISGSTITLDKPFNKTVGGTWTVTLYSADGATIQTLPITSAANPALSTITVTGTPTATVGSAYIVTGARSPRQFRMIGMADNGDLTYTVTAVQHDPAKYARIEQGIVQAEEVYWQNPDMNNLSQPTGLTVKPLSSINADGTIFRYLELSWNGPTDGLGQTYNVQWRRNDQKLESTTVMEPYARIDANFSGMYEFYVNSTNSLGVTSPTLQAAYNFNFESGVDGDLGPVTGLALEAGATVFSGAMRVVWNAPTTGLVKDYRVVLSTAGGVKFKEFDTSSTGFVYTYDENIADGGPRPSIQVTVFPRDTLNKLGQGLAATFNSQAAAAVTNLFVKGTSSTSFADLDLNVTWNAVNASNVNYLSDPNFGYFKVDVYNGTTLSRTSNVTTAEYTYTFNDNVRDNGQDTPNANVNIRVTVYNKLGQASATESKTFTAAAPPAVTALYVKGTTGTVFNESALNITFVSNLSNGKAYAASNVFKSFLVEAFNGTTVKRSNEVFSNAYSYTIEQNSQDNAGTPIRNPIIKVTAISKYNTVSGTASATFTNPAPAVPSNIVIQPGIGNYKVSFDKPTEQDYLGFFVWASTTSNFTPSAANLVFDGAGAYASINSTPGTQYYVKLAAYDHFGKAAKTGSGLNISGQSIVSAETAGITKSPTAPTTGMVEGDVYINTTDGKLYRYFNGAWTAAVPSVDLVGQVTDAQIAAVATTKLTGTVTDAQIAGINATKIGGQIVNNQIASVDTSKLNGQVTNAQIAGIDTTKLQGTIADAQIAGVAATKIAGQITNAQIAAVATTKLTGTVTDAQIAGVNATKLAGQITNAQIQSVDTTKLNGQITNAQIVAVDASKLQGSVTNAQIAAVDAAKLTGQISGVQIQDEAIFSPKIAAGAVVTGKLGVNAVEAGNIAAGAVTTGKLFVTGQGKAINADPGFYDTTAWQIEYGDVQFIANNETNTPYGPFVARANGSSHFQSTPFPIEQNKRYKVTTWARKLSGTGGFFLRMYCWNKEGQNIGYVLSPGIEYATLTANWVRYTADMIPPIGTVRAALSIDANNGGNGFSDFADARVEEFIGADLIVDGAIVAGKIATGAVTAGTVAAGAITAGTIASDVVTSANIQAGAITANKIGAGEVIAGKLAAGAVQAGTVAAGAITAGTIASDVVTSANIQAGAITSAKIGAGEVIAGKLAAGAVQAGTVAAGAISAGNIQSNAITTTHLAIGDFENLFNVGTGTNISGLPPSMSAQSDYAQFNSVWWNSIGESSPYTLELRNRDNVFGNVFPVKYGDEFYCSMLTVPFGGSNSIYPVSVGMILYNAAGEVVGFPVGAVRQPGANAAVKSEGVLTIDNGNATSAMLFFLINGPSDANFSALGVGAHLGGIQVRRRNKGNLIVDGAITANKIGAGEVVAGKLGAGAVVAGTVAANAITAGTIDANAVTAATIQGGAVTAGKIATGAVLAENIAAGAITTGKLYVSGQGKAINADPGYSDPTAWTKNGGDSLQFLFNGESNTPYGPYIARATNQVQFESNTFPIEQNKRYKVTTWARKQGGTSGVMYLRLQCFNKDGALTAYALVPSQEAVQLGTGWARYTGDIIPPVGTVRAKITVDANYQGNGYSDFADTRVEEFIGADLIVDGAIIAGKLAAGAVTAGTIATNAVTAGTIDTNAVTSQTILAGAISTDKMNVNSINGDRIAVNTLFADRIQAGTITSTQVATEGLDASRINTRGLSIKDGNGNVILAAGTALNPNYVPANALNSNVTAGSIGAIGNGNPLTANNASTYIASGAIDQVFIKDATIDTLKLRNGAINDIRSGNADNGSWSIEFKNYGTTNPIYFSRDMYTMQYAASAPAGLSGPFQTTILVSATVPRASYFGTNIDIITTLYLEEIQAGGNAWYTVQTITGSGDFNPAPARSIRTGTGNEFYQFQATHKPGYYYRVRVRVDITWTHMPDAYVGISVIPLTRTFKLDTSLTAITQLR